MNYEIYNADCLEILGNLGRHFDAIITSPPYNMNLRILNGKYTSRCHNKNHAKEFSTKYTSYDDDLSMDAYFDFQDKFLSCSLEISDLIFYNIQMVTGNKKALFKLLGKYADYIKEVIIWDKINSQPAIQEGVLNSQFEFLIVLDSVNALSRKFEIANFSRGTESNLWEIKRERNPEHKASFPKELIKRILLNFTKEDSYILDPFMGSGTTGVCCLETSRNFVGIEMDSEYFKISERKLKELSGRKLEEI